MTIPPDLGGVTISFIKVLIIYRVHSLIHFLTLHPQIYKIHIRLSPFL